MTPTPLLVVFDCDSTLIQDEVIELLADAAGTREHVAAVTERAMAGELDFAGSLRERVATLADVPDAVFAETVARVRPTPGVRELIDEVHRRGGKVGVVSGGFHEVLDHIARDLGIDVWRANRLEVRDGKLTGRTIGPVIDADAKEQALREWAEEFGVPLPQTIAIGDGANDLKMMGIAGLSIGFNPKPVVAAAADEVVRDDFVGALPLLDRVTPENRA